MASATPAQRSRFPGPRVQVTRPQLMVLGAFSAAGLLWAGFLLFGAPPSGPLSPTATITCLMLLSAAILLPLTVPPSAALQRPRFTIEPVVILNALYFIVGPILALLFKRYPTQLTAWPPAILVLSFGFLLFHFGVRSAKPPRAAEGGPAHEGSKALPAAFVISVVLLWTLRIVLLTRGLAITHGPAMAAYDRNLGTLATFASALAFFPLFLCLARLSNTPGASPRGGLWRTALPCVVASDILYYLLAGSRLPIIWELLFAFWVWRSRMGRVPRKLVVAGLLASLVALPLAYAQRALIPDLALRSHENQLKFTAEQLLPAERRLGDTGLLRDTERGFVGDATFRLNAVAYFSKIAFQHFEEGYPLMMGSSIAYGLPYLLPHAFWPGKPAQTNIDFIVDEHFGLFPKDELTTTESEFFANFGVLGLWVWMFAYGFLAGKEASILATRAPRESTLFLAFCMMPTLFIVETDPVAILAALRLPLALWVLLRALERGGKREPTERPLSWQAGRWTQAARDGALSARRHVGNWA